MTDPLASAQAPGKPASQAPAELQRAEALKSAARALETSFLAEMLKSAGFGEPRDAFGGGPGEDQFASFLRHEHAKAMVDAGGLGLAESLYHALKERSDATR